MQVEIFFTLFSFYPKCENPRPLSSSIPFDLSMKMPFFMTSPITVNEQAFLASLILSGGTVNNNSKSPPVKQRLEVIHRLLIVF